MSGALTTTAFCAMFPLLVLLAPLLLDVLERKLLGPPATHVEDVVGS
jgi:hypothetical protein